MNNEKHNAKHTEQLSESEIDAFIRKHAGATVDWVSPEEMKSLLNGGTLNPKDTTVPTTEQDAGREM